MPGKGRRVASRQSQLGQRRRRNSKNVQSATNTVMSPVLDSSNVIPDEPIAITTASRVVDVKSSVLGSRSRSNSTDSSSSDTYVRSEITRILILGSVLALALVVLSFLI